MRKAKKLIFTLAGVMILAGTVVFGVNAYFTSESRQHTEFTLIKTDTEIKEEIDTDGKKEIKVANTSSADCYVRVRLTVSPMELLTQGVLTLDEYNSDAWICEPKDITGDNEPDYYDYYYLNVLPAGEETEYLHRGYLFDSERYDELNLDAPAIDVTVYEESVQIIIPFHEGEAPLDSIKRSFEFYDQSR